MEIKPISIDDIQGFTIGQVEDEPGGTGVTVVISEKGARASGDVAGGAPATRETDLLKPENSVEEINAVVLSGGSAFGLEASCGVMDYLKEKGVGFNLGPFTVPIVVQASLFDLGVGAPDAYPDKAMGYKAASLAGTKPFEPGNKGAGTGATVAKMAGMEYAIKSGIGSFALQFGDLQVGAIVAVNAVGNIIDPSGQKMLAGFDPSALSARANTTIGVVITNADLSKASLNRVAKMAQDGIGRVIVPAHTPNDGDALFVMSSAEVPADVTLTGMLAAQAVEGAILNAVTSAKSAYGFKSIQESQQ